MRADSTATEGGGEGHGERGREELCLCLEDTYGTLVSFGRPPGRPSTPCPLYLTPSCLSVSQTIGDVCFSE